MPTRFWWWAACTAMRWSRLLRSNCCHTATVGQPLSFPCILLRPVVTTISSRGGLQAEAQLTPVRPLDCFRTAVVARSLCVSCLELANTDWAARHGSRKCPLQRPMFMLADAAGARTSVGHGSLCMECTPVGDVGYHGGACSLRF
jgi:hypothetical protein